MSGDRTQLTTLRDTIACAIGAGFAGLAPVHGLGNGRWNRPCCAMNDLGLGCRSSLHSHPLLSPRWRNQKLVSSRCGEQVRSSGLWRDPDGGGRLVRWRVNRVPSRSTTLPCACEMHLRRLAIPRTNSGRGNALSMLRTLLCQAHGPVCQLKKKGRHRSASPNFASSCSPGIRRRRRTSQPAEQRSAA